MKPLPVDVLATAMNASVNAALDVTGIQATGVAIDSRDVSPGDVFCALEGERVDGHDFAAEAIAAGAVAIITNRDIAGVPCLVTDNSLEALGRLAHWYRTHELSATVIAVTGSSGKTTTKDLIADVLPGAVVAARGSFNTEVGVPLTILEADPSTDYLVLEMGMRGIGHIAYLAEMAEPDIGVVLNVGLAHVGMMNGPEEIARAKSELVGALSADGFAVLNCDDFAVSVGDVAAGIADLGVGCVLVENRLQSAVVVSVVGLPPGWGNEGGDVVEGIQQCDQPRQMIRGDDGVCTGKAGEE